MTYTREEILSGNYDINNFNSVPYEEGEIYADPDGFWEILEIREDGVKIENIHTGQVWDGVRPEEVQYFCKNGLQNVK